LSAAGRGLSVPLAGMCRPTQRIRMLFVEVLAVVFAADLVSGLVHWWEDAYARTDCGPFKQVAIDNLRHHAKPREFLAKSYWQSSWDLWLLGAAAVAVAALLDAFSWHIVLFAVLVANANQIHKWAHRTREENGPIVAALQRLHLIQSTRHHSLHHQGLRNSHYCVITNFLNPILEELRLWSRLERLIKATTGIARRNDEIELAKMGLAPNRERAKQAHKPRFAVSLITVVPRWIIRPRAASAEAA
jgi:ubiquitin-conjugating enzyme E2 variant